ncbi:MAG: porin [Nitrospina sp.]|nr:porin [Nitrospina sp.]
MQFSPKLICFKGISILTLLFMFMLPQYSLAQGDDIRERLDEIERELLDLHLKQTDKTSVTAFDSMRLDLGGFITQTFTTTFNGDSPDRSSFDQTNFELLMGADVTDRDSLFIALGFLRQADLVNEAGLDVEQRKFADHANRIPGIIMWGRHDFDELLDVTYGRWITPWGIINREHFPPVLMNLSQPQYLRAVQPGNLFGGNTIVPNFLDGIQAHGSKYFGDYQAEYFAYVGNFDGSGSGPSDFISGARLMGALPNRIFTIGFDYQNGVRAVSGAQDSHYDAWGVDALIDYKGFLLKSEYLRSNERGATGNKESWYIQPSYTRGKFVLFYRWDVIDTDLDTVNDSAEQTEHVFGVNYFLQPTVRLRAEYVLNRFNLNEDNNGKKRDYDNIQLSITTSF